jgi:hypothetical protein
MSFIRSVPGFALALALGYAAGVLMCIDAYHLGQSSITGSGLTGPSDMTCHPRRQAPAHASFPQLAQDARTVAATGDTACIVPSTESVP